jgi:hypothetical protein
LSPRSLAEHLDPSVLPKRILALDGGGVRGILTLQYLEKIEGVLRQTYNNPTLVLSDYFDLIGGTSTGAIIAGGLVLGLDVATIHGLYRDLATKIFKKPFFRIGAFVPKFTNHSLQSALQSAYGADTTLGSPRLRTGLMIMTKRMDTGRPWPLTNQPKDPFFFPTPGKRRIGNGNMLLWQVVRASTAAPHYFRPEDVVIGSTLDPVSGTLISEHGQFVDGGVSTANNPSLQLLQIALLEGFAFNWQPGEDRLQLISVGTGLRSRRHGRARGWRATAGAFAASSLLSVMDDCNTQVETMMQWLSKSPTARAIDGQIASMADDHLAGTPLLHYVRYNVVLESGWMEREMRLTFDQATLNRLAAMDKPKNMEALAELGRAAAIREVKGDHFSFAVTL